MKMFKKTLSVIPDVGIGPLKLGMSPKQILDAINQLRSEWSLPDNDCIKGLQVTERKEHDGGLTFRYMGGSFFFLVEYRHDKAVEVAVDCQLREHALIKLYDMDVFKMEAMQLVTSLKQLSFCAEELEKTEQNYEFPDIGIRLWRDYENLSFDIIAVNSELGA